MITVYMQIMENKHAYTHTRSPLEDSIGHLLARQFNERPVDGTCEIDVIPIKFGRLLRRICDRVGEMLRDKAVLNASIQNYYPQQIPPHCEHCLRVCNHLYIFLLCLTVGWNNPQRKHIDTVQILQPQLAKAVTSQTPNIWAEPPQLLQTLGSMKLQGVTVTFMRIYVFWSVCFCWKN